MFSYDSLKKILFKFDPETAHNIAEYGLRVLGKCKIAKAYMQKKNYITDPKLTQKVFGVTQVDDCVWTYAWDGKIYVYHAEVC